MELIQNGPVVTWFDVNPNIHPWLGNGIYYNTNVCDNNEVVFLYFIFKKKKFPKKDEAVPPECAEEDGGYTCIGDCKRKMPQHCDRCDQTLLKRLFKKKPSTIFDSQQMHVIKMVHRNQIIKTL